MNLSWTTKAWECSLLDEAGIDGLKVAALAALKPFLQT